MNIQAIADLIVDVPDFPKKGIIFKDITPILENPEAFSSLAKLMNAAIPKEVTKLVAIESRGFILASAMAQHDPRGVVLMRKPGKLPRKTVSYSYELEYGTDTLELHEHSVEDGERIAIVDDVLATGGTAQAAELLVEKAGGEVVTSVFFMDIPFLKGGERLKNQYTSLFSV